MMKIGTVKIGTVYNYRRRRFLAKALGARDNCILSLFKRGLLAAAILAPAPALAAPCTAAGLTGIWSLVSIRSADPGVQAFYDQAPNEVMHFGARGDFIYVAGGAPYTAASARQSVDRADAMDGVSYAFRVEGERLMLLRDGQPFEGFTCRVADRAEGAARAGDIILSNLPGRPALQRVQRRLS